MRSLRSIERLTAEAAVSAARQNLEDKIRARRRSACSDEDVLVAADQLGAALEELTGKPATDTTPAFARSHGPATYRCERLDRGSVEVHRTGKAHWRTSLEGSLHEVAAIILGDVFGPSAARALEFNFIQDFRERLEHAKCSFTQDEIRRWADAQQQ
jgi:hypothetical protein